MPRSSLPTALRSSIARIAEAASSREYTEPSGGSLAQGSISGMRSRHCWPTNPGLMCQNSFEAAPMTVVLVSSNRSALTVGISREADDDEATFRGQRARRVLGSRAVRRMATTDAAPGGLATAAHRLADGAGRTRRHRLCVQADVP